RFDEQLAVRVAAEVESEKIETLGKGDDPGLGFIERQPPRLQPPGQPRLDLLSLLPGMTARYQVISISNEHRAAAFHFPGMNAGEAVTDTRGLLQPVQCDIQQQGRNNSALGRSLPGRRKPFPSLENPRLQPPGDHS